MAEKEQKKDIVYKKKKKNDIIACKLTERDMNVRTMARQKVTEAPRTRNVKNQ